MGTYITTNLRLPDDLHKLLKHMAVEEKKSVSQLVREAIADFMAARKEPESPKGEDPFSSLIGAYSSGLKDGSVKHDEYLYGRKK